MKKKISTLLVFFALVTTSFAQVCNSDEDVSVFNTPFEGTPATTSLDFVIINPFDVDVAMAGGSGALIKLNREGDNWKATVLTNPSAHAETRYRHVEFVAENDWYLTADNTSEDFVTVYRSTDQGTTWTSHATSPTITGSNRVLYQVLVHPEHTNWMMLLTRNGLYITKDHGANWVQQSNTGTAPEVTRYYYSYLNLSTGEITIAVRQGYVISTIITDFSVDDGIVDATWTDEITPTSAFGSVTVGSISPNMVSSPDGGATIYVVTDSHEIPVLRKKEGTWSAVPVGNFEAANADARWIDFKDEDIALIIDNSGHVFYTNNLSDNTPDWVMIQANAPSYPTETYKFNRVSVSKEGDVIEALVAGNPTLNDADEAGEMAGLSQVNQVVICSEDLPETPSNVSIPRASARPMVWPNPSKGLINIELEQAAEARILNAYGQEILAVKLSRGLNSIGLPVSQGGIHVMQIRYPDNYTESYKLIIE